MFKTFVLGASLSFGFSGTSLARNPVGDFAKYELDKGSGRTSYLIRSGNLETRVLSEGAGVYRSTLAYDVNVLMAGRKKGVEELDVPAEFFSKNFRKDLRRHKISDQGIFKLKHLGVETVTTKSGITYKDCDKILAYDIKMNESSDFQEFIQEALKTQYEFLDDDDIVREGVRDAKVVLHITDGIPVLGAAKIDVSGVVSGFRMKAGFDYAP